MPLSLNDVGTVERKPLLDLSDQAPPPHTDAYKESQAAKMHLALGEQSPGLDTIAGEMASGNESSRRLLAEREQLQKVQAQNDILESVLTSDPSAITPEVVDVIQGLSVQDMRSPDLSDIVEREYAKRFVNTGVSTLENDILEDALAADPDKTYEIMDRAESFAYKSNYLNTILDQAQKEVDDQSWLSTVYNLGENILIGSYQTYGQVDLDDLPAMPGKNRLEGYAFLWSLQDPDEFKGYMDRIAEDLKSRNPYAFREWFQGMVSFGNDEAALSTVTAGMDLAGLVPVGRLGTAVKSLLKASSMNPMKMSEIAGVVGKNLDSGIGRMAEDVAEGSIFGSIKNAKDLERSMPNFRSPDKMMSGGTNISTASYDRLTQAALKRRDLVDRILSANTIDRLTPEEVVALRDDLSAQFMRDNPQIAKNVISVEAPDTPDVGNVYTAKVIIGQRDGSLFESFEQADNYVKKFIKPKTDDYQIRQKGDGFQVEIDKTLNEDRIWDFRIDTNQQTPRSISDVTRIGSWLRTPTELLSRQQNVARAVLTSSKEKIDTLFSELAAPIGNLSKKELNELDDLLFINQKDQTFYNNIGEFDQAFYDRFQKLPTDNQREAYFTYTDISDLDLAIRDLDWYKQKAALGFEDISIDLKAVRSEDEIEYWKESFEGRVVEDLPYTDPTPFKVGIIENGELKSVKFSPTMGEAGREAISKLKDEGYKIINAVDSGFNIDGKFLDYVVVKDFQRSRVGVKNVDRKPGGHKIPRDQYYIKQGRISGDEGYRLYRGDQTFFNARSEKEANEFARLLEEARQKLLANAPDAKKFIRDNLPIPVREFMAGVADGSIDLTHPFVAVRSGQRTIDTAAYKSLDLKDITRSTHKPADQITGRFAGERSEVDIPAIRSESNVRWRIEGAPYLSPLEAMKTASSDMISTRLFNDYKIMTLRNYIREFGDVLEGSPAELRAQGLDVIQNPKFNAGAERSPELARKVQRARNVSRAFNTLMDNSDPVSRSIELFKERLISPILPKVGPRGAEWLSETMISKSKNPGARLKSIAFHTKMGFWNLNQYFKQANSAINVVAVGGINGMKSAGIYVPLRVAALTNDTKTIERLGQIVQNVGVMSKDDFIESVSLYKKSGFNDIGGDTAYLDDLRSPELVESKFTKVRKRIMKTSATPFYEGERLSRLAAWNTAYLEKKAALKGKKLTRRDEADILYRAKALIGNMTRESNAPWQKGYASVITQFFGYQARIMDQMIGKQLTAGERARLFVAYSMMYGMPVGVAAGVGILPVRDIVVRNMYEMGMDPNDPAAKPFIDGFVSAFTNFAFGKDWNIASSYGPGGLPTFYDFFRGDKEFSDLLLGASGGIVADILSQSWEGLVALRSETEDFEGGIYNLVAEDVINVLRNITTFDSAHKIYQVYNAGRWMSKNGYDIAKMELPDAVFAAITGLQPASIEQAFSKRDAAKSLKKQREEAMFDFIKRLKNARRMESGETRERVIRQLKAEMETWGFTGFEKSQINKRAWDSKTLEDISLEQFDKEMKRKRPAVNEQDSEGE